MLLPEQVTSVTAQYPASGGSPLDISLYSIFPHMHLLGKEIGSYAVKPGQDTLPLIDIPHWDFDWQDFYKFRYLQKIRQGSTVHGYGTFDNTSSNIHNPFSPPQTIFFGLNTTDEMFITYFQYLPYVTGDENYDLTDLTALSLEEYLPEGSSGINVYPNPFGIDGIRISFMEPLKPNDQVYVYDNLGNRVAIVPHNNEKELIWNGTNENGQVVKSGVYYVSVNIEGVHSHQKIIKIK